MNRRTSALALLGLVAPTLAMFREIVLEGRVLYERDIHLVWEAYSAAFVRAWRLGAWPLWDDTQGFGQSLVANPAAQVFYPPTWLALALPFGAYCTLYVVGHALGSGMGFFLLGRRLGLSPLAAFAAAALWIVSGPFSCAVSLWHHFAGAAWLPWVLLGLLNMRRRGAATGVVLASLPLGGQILAGSADLCALTLVLGGALLLVAPEDGAPGRWRALALMAAAVLLALGLTSPQWSTSLEAVLQSPRSELGQQVRTYWSLHPLGLLDLVLPVPLAAWPLRAEARAVLFESREPFLPSLYLGLVGLPLVVAAFAHPKRRLPWLFAGVGLLGLLVSLGRHAPFYGVLTALVPPLRILRYPVKAVFLVAFGWVSLAGLGVDVWLERASSARRRAAVLVGLAAALLVLVALLPAISASAARSWLEPGQPFPWIRLLGLHLGLAAAACALAGWAAWRGSPSLRQGVAVVILLGAMTELVVALAPLNPTAPRAFYAYRPAVFQSLTNGPVSRVYVYNYAAVAGKSQLHLGRVSPFALRTGLDLPAGPLAGALSLRSYLFPASASSWGLRYGYDPDMTRLAPREVVQLHLLLWTTEGTPAQLRLLQLGSVSHVVTLHDVRSEGLEPAGEFPELLPEPVRLWRVPDPLPRFLIVGGVRGAGPLEALALLADGSVDPRAQVILPEGVFEAPPADFRGTVRVAEERPGFQKLEAEVSHSGHLVVLDAFAPGWQARLDGRAVPLLRADGAFRAIALPPGRHEIECRYVPSPLLWGGGLSLGLLAGVLAVLGRGVGRGAIRPP